MLTVFSAVCAIFMVETSTNVYAADPVTVELKLAGQNEKNITVDMNEKGGEQLTNGKFRITYDPDQLKLTGHKDGSLGEKAMFVRNDCIDGNKNEGEIVVTFASAGNLGGDGSFDQMEFAVKDQVKEKDEITIKAAVEELSTQDGDVESTSIPLTLTMQKDGTVKPASGAGNDQKDDSTKEDSKKNPEKGSNVSENKKTVKAGTGSTAAGAKKASNAKTGDGTNILLPVLGVVIAAAVIIALAVLKKKKSDE
jgi:LPXTG-motif cell wall-anchored protein